MMDLINTKTDCSSNIFDAILSLDYEAQHFGFHPRNLLDLVYNVFFENVSTCLTEMKQYMMHEFKGDLLPAMVATQIDNFLQKLCKVCDKCIDKLEVFLNTNVFSIEPHIVLPEDEVHIKNPCTKEEEEKLDAEIEELKQKFLIEKGKKYSLKKKISEQRKIKEKLVSFQNELKYLLSIAYQESMTPENIESLYSDLKELLNMNGHI